MESVWRTSSLSTDISFLMGRSAPGAHLLNLTRGTHAELYDWRARNEEVDFVLAAGTQILAVEVKSGRWQTLPSGMSTFMTEFAAAGTIRSMLVGSGGIPVETFLATSLPDLLS